MYRIWRFYQKGRTSHLTLCESMHDFLKLTYLPFEVHYSNACQLLNLNSFLIWSCEILSCCLPREKVLSKPKCHQRLYFQEICWSDFDQPSNIQDNFLCKFHMKIFPSHKFGAFLTFSQLEFSVKSNSLGNWYGLMSKFLNICMEKWHNLSNIDPHSSNRTYIHLYFE